MSGKHRYVPEVSMLSEEVDYAALHKMSAPRGSSDSSEECYTPGLLEMWEMSQESGPSERPDPSDMPGGVWNQLKRDMAAFMSDLSEESVLAGFVPSVVMCAACGMCPAQDRKASVVALCEECAARLFQAVLAEMSDKSFKSPHDRYRAVYAYLTEKYGYEMMDAELSKMFD